MQRVILDTVGPSAAYTQHQQTLLMLQRQAEPLTQLFATYQAVPSPDSGIAAWWSGLQGQARALSDLSPAEQKDLRLRWQQALDRLHRLARELEQRGDPEQARSLQVFLDSGLTGALYSIGGKPLVVLSQNPKLSPQPLAGGKEQGLQGAGAQAMPASSLARVASAPSSPSGPTEPPDGRGLANSGSRFAWWWLVLAALLLLGLILFLCWRFALPASLWDAAPETMASREASSPRMRPPPDSAGPATQAPICVKDEAGRTLGPELYVIFDTSSSMLLGVDADLEDENWFFELNEIERMALAGDERQRAQNLFLGTARITAARQAFSAMVDGLPAQQDIHMVSFSPECQAPQYWGGFKQGQRGQLKSLVQAIEPENSTNLADALSLAASRVDGVQRDALIVLFVDGGDGCGKDVCALAHELAQAKPRLRINVVDITGQGLAACAAQTTGGKILAPQQASQISQALKQAAVEAVERVIDVCE